MSKLVSDKIVDELLLTATHLYKKSSIKKKLDSDLRRSVSTAYYALFHFTIIETINLFCTPLDVEIKIKLCRNFDHGAMKEVFSKFIDEIKKYDERKAEIERDNMQVIASRNTKPSKNLQPVIGKTLQNMNLPVDSVVKDLAINFIVMQNKRHSADYDLSWKIEYIITEALVKKVESVIANWRQSNNPDKAILLLSIFSKIR